MNIDVLALSETAKVAVLDSLNTALQFSQADLEYANGALRTKDEIIDAMQGVITRLEGQANNNDARISALEDRLAAWAKENGLLRGEKAKLTADLAAARTGQLNDVLCVLNVCAPVIRCFLEALWNKEYAKAVECLPCSIADAIDQQQSKTDQIKWMRVNVPSLGLREVTDFIDALDAANHLAF